RRDTRRCDDVRTFRAFAHRAASHLAAHCGEAEWWAKARKAEVQSQLRSRRLCPPYGDVSGASFDHLVGGKKQPERHLDAERGGGLAVDDELELGRQLHRQVAGLGALEDAVDVKWRQ